MVHKNMSYYIINIVYAYLTSDTSNNTLLSYTQPFSKIIHYITNPFIVNTEALEQFTHKNQNIAETDLLDPNITLLLKE